MIDLEYMYSILCNIIDDLQNYEYTNKLAIGDNNVLFNPKNKIQVLFNNKYNPFYAISVDSKTIFALNNVNPSNLFDEIELFDFQFGYSIVKNAVVRVKLANELTPDGYFNESMNYDFKNISLDFMIKVHELKIELLNKWDLNNVC